MVCVKHGYSVATDAAGDQFVESYVTDKHSLDQKTWKGSLTLSGGTEKFAGMTGSGTFVFDGNTFRLTGRGPISPTAPVNTAINSLDLRVMRAPVT
jgi:hypothetical protein